MVFVKAVVLRLRPFGLHLSLTNLVQLLHRRNSSSLGRHFDNERIPKFMSLCCFAPKVKILLAILFTCTLNAIKSMLLNV